MRHDILIHELFIRLSYFITWVRSKTMQEDGTVNNRRNNKGTSFVSLSNVILLSDKIVYNIVSYKIKTLIHYGVTDVYMYIVSLS